MYGSPAILGGAGRTPGDKPNLLFLWTDEQRADTLAVYGTLEASGQGDNTLVVFTSDHGEMMGSHSLIGKQVLYEESIRVPLLIRAPFRHTRPGVIEQPVSHIDLVPTLLELMGSKSRPALPGQSLVPLLQGERVPQDHVFIQWHSAATVVEALVKRLSGAPNARAVISPEGWKLGIHDSDNDLLFHRERDPKFALPPGSGSHHGAPSQETGGLAKGNRRPDGLARDGIGSHAARARPRSPLKRGPV